MESKLHLNALVDYGQLSALEKAILQLLSLAYIQVNKTQLINSLMQLNIKAEGGQDFHECSKNDKFSYLRPSIDRLFELQLLYGTNRSYLKLVPELLEGMTRQCVLEQNFDPYLAVVRKFILEIPEETSATPTVDDVEQLVALIRILFYQGRKEEIAPMHAKYLQSLRNCPTLDSIIEQRAASFRGTFEPEWFELLAADRRRQILGEPVIKDLRWWTNEAPHWEYIEQLLQCDSPSCEYALKETVLEKWLLCGQKQRVSEWLNIHGWMEKENSLCLRGSLAFMEGKHRQAIQLFESALSRAATTRNPRYFENFSGVFYLLALLQENTPQSLEEVQKHLNSVTNGSYTYQEAYKCLHYPLALLQGKAKQAKSIYAELSLAQTGYCGLSDCIKHFLGLFCYYWIDPEQARAYTKDVKKLAAQAQTSGYLWFHCELEALYKSLSKDRGVAAEGIAASALAGIVQRNNIWEKTLNALLELKQPPKKPATKGVAKVKGDADLRMAWFVEFTGSGQCKANPREQKLDAKGKWSKGRPIALKNLCLELAKYGYISQQDREVLSHLHAHQYKDGWYTNTEYIFNDNYLYALIAHPLIFLEDGETKLELIKGKPELLVTQQKGGGFGLNLWPKPTKYMAREQYLSVQEGRTRVKLVKVDEDYHRIAEILGEGISVPASASAKVQQLIEKLAPDILINSDLAGKGGQVEEVQGNPRIHVQLLPAGRGLKLGLFVRPLAAGAYYAPGSGGRMVISEVRGTRLQTLRDLKLEQENAALLVRQCPTLMLNADLPNEWELEDPASCLEALFELGNLKQDIVLEWPEGEKFKLLGQTSFKHFHLNIKRQKDWFLATGSLQLDNQSVIDMQKLLELSAATRSRFLEIRDGQFIALTHEFHKRLQELDRYSERHGKGVRFHPLAALALESLTSDAGQLDTDQDWKNHLQKFRNLDEQQYAAPSTLQAELRDYQLEGVRWMSRLAHWQVGACLADDMGLGKTLQAMALLLKHAPDGPSLVIAPTSVCMNWHEEAKRFAPTLKLIQFGGGNREKTVQALGKFDVLVCSYGLLQQGSETLCAVSWQMVVLDEAQAIKNFFTKRSRAAMNLEAKFKLIMTGTPIENHLGELWNLFQFINPGLLGSLEEFNQKYVLPVERDNDPQARLHLKKLIQPVILRRTKSRVLEELPARTEIRLQVELSKEEAAFYEALRLQAVQKLAEEDAKPGGKHLKILAEIMKLRRACCNTRLVHDDIALPSSKLAVFGEVLQELLENKHKALVFSQFVGHLGLIRAYLDEQKISYQYLDGSTPVNERKLAVDAFQAGQGEVFLISLKAGGLGLNLTAADYVIHMDPWWNPAVEDQASDRAHRIGQLRPVTIYRLVAKGTIEEKIVEMHSRKRDLADSLLDGSDMSAKLSTEDLLGLLDR